MSGVWDDEGTLGSPAWESGHCPFLQQTGGGRFSASVLCSSQRHDYGFSFQDEGEMHSWGEHDVDAWGATDMNRDEVKLSFLIVWLILSVGILLVLVAPFVVSADTIAALVPTCVWKAKYGRECPLWGMTTSFIQISHGNFKQAPTLLSGWARVRANGRIGVAAVISRFDSTGSLLGQMVIEALPSGGRELSVYAHLQPTSVTGIILVNPSDQATDVLLSVVDRSGLRILAARSVTLPKLGQLVQALDELFPTLSPFDGGRIVVSGEASLRAMGFFQFGTQMIAIPALVIR